MYQRLSTRLPLVFCALLMALLWPPAVGRAEPGGPETALALGDEMLLFEDIPSVYSASKYEQKVTEAPSSISIVTAEEIKKYGYRNFGEILQSIRGFYVTYDRNYSYLGVRGFGLPSDYNNRVLVMVDGLRINDNIYDSAAVGIDFPVDIDLIDRVEVVRGPSSSLYGTSAFFAVINVITKRGRDYQGVEVNGAVGTFDTYETRLTYGSRLNNEVEFLLSGTYEDSQGDDELFFREFADPDQNFGVAQDLDYGRLRKFFGELRYRDFTAQGSYYYSKKGIPTAPWETIFNDQSEFSVDEQGWLDLKYEHIYDDGLGVLARINYNYYKYYGDYPYEGDPTWNEPPVVINDDSAKGQWVYGELQLTKELMEKHTVTVGAEFQDNFQQDQKSVYVGVTDWGGLDDKRDSNNWALYLQDDFAITDKLILNAGIRHDDYDSFGGTTNPRAALIYSPSEKTSLKAIYGQAFRAPNVYELYFNDSDVSSKANPDLDPETIKTYELVWEQYVGLHLRWTAVGFIYNIKDLITQQEDPADGLLVFENVSEVKAKGIELEIEGKWDNGMQGRVSYTYQDTEDQDTDSTLTNSPEHLAKLNWVIPVLEEKLFLSFEEQYTAKRKTLRRNQTDDFFITNVTLFNQNWIKGLELSASVYNLFDNTYADPGAGEHLQDSLEQDGRTYFFEATWAF